MSKGLGIEELKYAAGVLAKDHLEAFEFLDIAEDADFEGMSEEDQQKLHTLVVTANVTLSWSA